MLLEQEKSAIAVNHKEEKGKIKMEAILDAKPAAMPAKPRKLKKWMRVVISVLAWCIVSDILTIISCRIYFGLEGLPGLYASCALEVATSTLLLFLFCKVTGRRLGSYFKIKGFKESLVVVIPVIIGTVLSVYLYHDNMKIVLPLLVPLVADVYVEEVTYRGIVTSYGLMLCRSKKDIRRTILLCSLFFAFAHYWNLTSGRTFSQVTQQVFGVIPRAILMTAAFALSDSLLPGLLIHVVQNVQYKALIWGTGAADVGSISASGGELPELTASSFLLDTLREFAWYFIPILILLFITSNTASRRKTF